MMTMVGGQTFGRSSEKRRWRTLRRGLSRHKFKRKATSLVLLSTCPPLRGLLLALAEPSFGRRRVQPHSVNPVTFACIVSCERGNRGGGYNRYPGHGDNNSPPTPRIRLLSPDSSVAMKGTEPR